jgi:hypothetical protein
MEDRVMGGVDLVATVHIAYAQEGGDALGDEFTLVRRRVRAQHLIRDNQ